MTKLTKINFEKHELRIVDNEHVKIHHLTRPSSSQDNIKFINCGGIMAVTGDYGNWIFCREFIPKAGEHIDPQYAAGKLKIASEQNPYEMDSQATMEEIQELMNSKEYEGKDFEYLKELLEKAEECGEPEYKEWAYDNCPSDMFEVIPYRQDFKYWLKAVFDGFNEICERLKTVKYETE